MKKIDEARAMKLCRAGLTPAEVERHVYGVGLAFMAQKWMLPVGEAIALAVYYGVMEPNQAIRLDKEIRGEA